MIISCALRGLASSLDLVACRLECCISTRRRSTTLIEGKLFFISRPPAAIDALRAMNVGAVSLANNHALDFGEETPERTLAPLDTARIATAGAGPWFVPYCASRR